MTLKFIAYNLFISTLIVLATMYGQQWALNIVCAIKFTFALIAPIIYTLLVLAYIADPGKTKKQCVYRDLPTNKSLAFDAFNLILLAAHGHFCVFAAYLIAEIFAYLVIYQQNEWAKEVREAID